MIMDLYLESVIRQGLNDMTESNIILSQIAFHPLPLFIKGLVNDSYVLEVNMFNVMGSCQAIK